MTLTADMTHQPRDPAYESRIRASFPRQRFMATLGAELLDVRPGEVWEVAFRARNPGIWMNHCHNLPHAHQGMMLRLCYDGVTTPFHGSHTARGAGTAGSRNHGR